MRPRPSALHQPEIQRLEPQPQELQRQHPQPLALQQQLRPPELRPQRLNNRASAAPANLPFSTPDRSPRQIASRCIDHRSQPLCRRLNQEQQLAEELLLAGIVASALISSTESSLPSTIPSLK